MYYTFTQGSFKQLLIFENFIQCSLIIFTPSPLHDSYQIKPHLLIPTTSFFKNNPSTSICIANNQSGWGHFLERVLPTRSHRNEFSCQRNRKLSFENNKAKKRQIPALLKIVLLYDIMSVPVGNPYPTQGFNGSPHVSIIPELI